MLAPACSTSSWARAALRIASRSTFIRSQSIITDAVDAERFDELER
jgi:hypothetical protein